MGKYKSNIHSLSAAKGFLGRSSSWVFRHRYGLA